MTRLHPLTLAERIIAVETSVAQNWIDGMTRTGAQPVREPVKHYATLLLDNDEAVYGYATFERGYGWRFETEDGLWHVKVKYNDWHIEVHGGVLEADAQHAADEAKRLAEMATVVEQLRAIVAA